MNRIVTVMALTAAICWPAGVLAASDRDVPGRGMSKAEVRAQFGEPNRARPAVGQPPISRWDYDGFSVYFENDTTLHSVREQDRTPTKRAPSAEAQGEQPDAHSTPEAEAGLSPANGKEPPTTLEEQETNVEVETFGTPSNKDEEEDEDSETSTESDSAPGSTAVRANADSAGKQEQEEGEEDTKADGDQSSDASSADEGRFRFDPATGRIVVDDEQEDDDSDSSPAR